MCSLRAPTHMLHENKRYIFNMESLFQKGGIYAILRM